MIQLPLFDTTAKTPYEKHQEMYAAMRHAFKLLYEEMVGIEPETTGIRFHVKLPDGRKMVVNCEIDD